VAERPWGFDSPLSQFVFAVLELFGFQASRLSGFPAFKLSGFPEHFKYQSLT
jgi:hypothetical protein